MLTYPFYSAAVRHILHCITAAAPLRPLQQEASMSAVTFPKSLAGQKSVSVQAAGTPAKGFFARVLDAIIAARSAQAEREIARHMRGYERGER